MPVRVGVIGDPVAHSLSPAMHNAAFKKLGMDWAYDAVRVRSESFEEELSTLIEQGYVGLNVTVPHKLRAFEYAKQRGQLSEAAKAIGAVNVLKFKDGGVDAGNTDAGGLQQALTASGYVAGADGRALVLGAGGTARAAVWALLDLGVGSVEIWNRTRERAEAMLAELEASGIDVARITLVSEPGPAAKVAGLTVNTTSVGMEAAESPACDLVQLGLGGVTFESGQFVADFVYGAEVTPLVRTAQGSGAATVGGLEILLRQGALSFSFWTGIEPPLGVMRAALS